MSKQENSMLSGSAEWWAREADRRKEECDAVNQELAALKAERSEELETLRAEVKSLREELLATKRISERRGAIVTDILSVASVLAEKAQLLLKD